MNAKISDLALFVTIGALLALGEAALAPSGTTKRAEPGRKTTAPSKLTEALSSPLRAK